MKNFFIAFLLVGLSVFCTLAQSERPFPMKENALLWKVEGKGLKQNVFLFGTIHLIEQDYFYFPEELKSIIQNSEQIILELGELDQTQALKHVLLSKGSFFDYFSKEQNDSIITWATDQLDMNEAQFRLVMNKMKPFVAVQLAAQMNNGKKMESYELTIQSMAKENNIPIFGLETVESQIGIFDSMDSTQQNQMVMETIRQFAQQDSILQQMYQIYTAQNIDEMYSMITNEPLLKEMQATLIDDRNRAWIPKIKKLSKKKNTFVAVGAGHLGGPNGVIRLLEREGYLLTPVKY